MFKNYQKSETTTLVIIALLYLILLLASPSGFWIIDEGNKYLWAENFSSTGSLKLADHSGAVSPGHSSFRPPFSIPAKDNAGQITVFSPLFIVLISPLVKIGGWKAAALFPLLSTLLLLHLCKILAGRLQIEYRWYTTLLLGAASPLLFYSITLWEHTLALALLLGGLILALPEDQNKRHSFYAGILFALAFYLRPETGIFALTLWIFLTSWKKSVIFGGITTLILLIPFNWLLTGSPIPLQTTANFITRWSELSAGQWLITRLDAIYALLLQSSDLWYLSIIPIISLLCFLFLPGVFKLLFPLSLLVLGVVNWFNPDPFLDLGEHASMLYTAPVFLLPLLAKPENAAGKKIRLALLIAVPLVILSLPVYKGIHFGPRLLLTLIPLGGILFTPYIARLYKTGQIFRFDALIGLLAFQIFITAWSVDLLFTRRAANLDRQEILLSKSNPALVTLQWWLPQEIPALHRQRECFTVDNELDFRIMLLDFYRKGFRFFTVIIADSTHSPLLDFVNAAPPRQIGAFSVPAGFTSMNLTGVDYAIGFDVDGAAKLADELGVYFGQIGKLDESEKYLRLAVEWKNNIGKYHYNLGYCLGNQGRYREALEEIDTASRLDPENPVIDKVLTELREKLQISEISSGEK